MTALLKTCSRDVRELFDSKSKQIISEKLNPSLALKCLHQMSQNIPYSHKNSKNVAVICQYVTQGVLTGLISWSEVSATINVMVRYFGNFFGTEGITDLNLSSLQGVRNNYSRLLLMHHALNLRQRWKDKPNENNIEYDKLIPIAIGPFYFDHLYKSFISKCFDHAYLYNIHELRSIILQCKDWDYLQGYEAYQRILIERLDNIGEVLSEYNFALEYDLYLVIAHCREFFENFSFYIDESDGLKKIYLTHYVLSNDFLLAQVLPSDRERRVFCRGQNQYEGNFFLEDMHVECIEISENKVNLEVCRKVLNRDEFIAFRILIRTLKQVKISFESTTLVVNGAYPFPNNMLIGLLKMRTFTGIDFIRHPDITMSLMDMLSSLDSPLEQMRIIQCPEVKREIIDKIPALFPKLNLFALNGGVLLENTVNKFLALPLTSLMLSSCAVHWPDNLSGLENLHTLELTYTNISAKDLNRLIKSIKVLKSVILIGIENFDIEMLSPHLFNIERITLSASSLGMTELNYLTRFIKLKAVYIEGTLKPSIKHLLNQFVEVKQLRVGYIGNL